MQATLFTNAKIHTMDENGSVAEAMLVKDGVIQAVGDSSEMAQACKGNIQSINMKGRLVLPGLIDTHTHFIRAALSEVDRPQFVPKSVEQILQHVRRQAALQEKGTWIYMPNVYPTRIADLRFPTIEELDACTTDHPVFVDGFYAGAGNTLALKTAGLWDSRERGVIVDEQEKPTGRVLGKRNVFAGFIPQAAHGKEELDRAIEQLGGEYAKCGITSITEGMSSLEGVEALTEAHRKGQSACRTVCTFVMDPTKPEALEKQIRKTQQAPIDYIRPLYGKMVVDGGILTGTAYMRTPYVNVADIFGYDLPDFYGTVATDFDSMAKGLAICESMHLKFCVHTTGNAGVDLFLDVLEDYKKKNGELSSGHAIIHGNFIDDHTLCRIKDLRVALLFQPAWFYKDAHAMQRVLDPDVFDTFLPYDRIYASNIRCAAGSDHMIKHDKDESQNPYNPFSAMYSMITGMNEQGEPLGSKHAVNRWQALSFYTRKAVYEGSGHEKTGRLQPGCYADFFVPDVDFFTCDVKQIPTISSSMTVLGGKIVHSSR